MFGAFHFLLNPILFVDILGEVSVGSNKLKRSICLGTAVSQLPDENYPIREIRMLILIRWKF